MARVYRLRQPPGDDAVKWENYFCLASALVGAGWGLALMLIGHTPTSLQELTVTFLISSIAMGLPPSLAPSPKAFTSFILPILAPMVAMLLTFGGGLNTSTALLMLVFATVLLGLYLSNHFALIETLAYGHENTLLLKKLRVAEKSLTAALAEQQLIFDTAAVGIAFVSNDKVIKCNRRFAEILGYTMDEIAGQPTRVWILPEADFMQPERRRLRPARAGGKLFLGTAPAQEGRQSHLGVHRQPRDRPCQTAGGHHHRHRRHYRAQAGRGGSAADQGTARSGDAVVGHFDLGVGCAARHHLS